MRLFLPLLFCLTSFCCIAQNEFQPLNRDSVEKLVTDASQPTYYRTLLSRFESFDTTLTLSDYRLLYFGFAFQPSYSGYATHKKKEIFEALKNKDYKNASRLCDEVLKEIPISLVANYYKGLSLYNLNENDATAMGYRTRYRGLRDAILSTGNGLACNTSFRVLFVGDEYEIIYNYFEIEKVMMQSLNYPCDKLEVTPSKYFQASKIYFDTSESMLNLQKKLKKSKNDKN